MSVNVNGTTITMTRGDTAVIQVSMTRDGASYTPVEGDTVRFAMRPAGLNSKGTEYKNPVCLEKTIPNETMLLTIEPQDTAEFGFGEYVYDIQITFADGTVDTFITTATLMLTPEVGNEQYNSA